MLIHVKATHYDFYKRRINELCDAFPLAFSKSFPHPLVIGIHKQLAERTSFTPKEISVLLRIWTHRAEYLAMGQSVGSRVDLDGNLTLMSEEHVKGFVAIHPKMRDHFIKGFSKRFKKAYGRPAFLAVPISLRKEIEVKGCSGCENCKVAARSNN